MEFVFYLFVKNIKEIKTKFLHLPPQRHDLWR
jgi:hypothetical protein